MIPDLLEIAALRAAYAAGDLTPEALIATLYERIEAYRDKAVFISLVPKTEALAAARALKGHAALPLYGIPYVVKDNIDVAGMMTTAACPDFAYPATQDATCIAKLRAAGAILLGKTNLDQFATGLNGTRSPYGAPRSVFNADYISGGSSSGSAVAVAAGLACFALGTDTAGSGRVPAAFNNIVGLKPTIGRISATGVVPACKSLDCVAIFANSAGDAMTVLKVVEGYDPTDAYSRPTNNIALPAAPRLGVLKPKDRHFAGDAEAAALYADALAKAEALGWQTVTIDYAPFRDIAALLYGGAFVAERLAAIETFFTRHAASVHPVVREIIAGAHKFSAADAFSDIYKVQALRQAARAEFATCDALLLPTAPTLFSVADILEEPIRRNADTRALYQFRQSARPRRRRAACGFPDRWPALRCHAHRSGLCRCRACPICRNLACRARRRRRTRARHPTGGLHRAVRRGDDPCRRRSAFERHGAQRAGSSRSARVCCARRRPHPTTNSTLSRRSPQARLGSQTRIRREPASRWKSGL